MTVYLVQYLSCLLWRGAGTKHGRHDSPGLNEFIIGGMANVGMNGAGKINVFPLGEVYFAITLRYGH